MRLHDCVRFTSLTWPDPVYSIHDYWYVPRARNPSEACLDNLRNRTPDFGYGIGHLLGPDESRQSAWGTTPCEATKNGKEGESPPPADASWLDWEPVASASNLSGSTRRRSRRPAESRDSPRTPAKAARGRRCPSPPPRVLWRLPAPRSQSG